ncbi:hypothetical protein Bca101_070669 [Brassica carinata]
MFHRKRTGNMNPESKTAPITRRKVAHHRHNIPSPEAHKPPETGGKLRLNEPLNPETIDCCRFRRTDVCFIKEIQLHVFNHMRIGDKMNQKTSAKIRKLENKSGMNPEPSRPKPPEKKVARQSQKPVTTS